MLYSTVMAALARARHGEPAEVADADATGLVLLADGVGGLDLCEVGLRRVLGEGGGRHRVRVARWGHGLGRWHADLTDVANHRDRARAMAGEVLAWREARPGMPAYLVGKSGGSAIVVGALEGLPEGSVEAAVLLAPALSPGYDLSGALGAVRRELVVFWSPLDLVILGAGTWLFGTVDRVRSVGAGMVGFRPPSGLDEAGLARYARLRQVRWGPAMASTGYLGGHVGPDSPAFLRKYVAPLLAGGGGRGAGRDVESRRGSSPSGPAPIT